MDGDHRVTIEGPDGSKIETSTKQIQQHTKALEARDAAQAQVRSFIERVERLEEEKREIAEQIKEVLQEAQGMGFSPKALKEIVKFRRMDAADRQELAALVEVYASALADFGDTPLGAYLTGSARPN